MRISGLRHLQLKSMTIPIAFDQSLKVVGVDVGIKDFAVSDGVVYKSQNLRKAEGKIKSTT